MCGIVGYVGPRPAVDIVVQGLRRLEYRGYDSAGVAVVSGGALHLAKKAGKLANLEKELAENPVPLEGVGIGHTRWATHGAPTDGNAHPHVSAGGRVALVHNGIIENFVLLRAELERGGVQMVSATDTEVVAHLLGQEVEAGRPLDEAMRAVCGCALRVVGGPCVAQRVCAMPSVPCTGSAESTDSRRVILPAALRVSSPLLFITATPAES